MRPIDAAAALPVRQIHDSAHTSPASPTHAAAEPDIQPIDASSAVSPVRSISIAVAALPHM